MARRRLRANCLRPSRRNIFTRINTTTRLIAGPITHFIAGLGTSGTFVGTSRRLKELNPAIQVISMQPDSPFHGLEGLKHMATALVPGIYDPQLADENVAVATEAGQQMSGRLAREEGLLVGASS